MLSIFLFRFQCNLACCRTNIFSSLISFVGKDSVVYRKQCGHCGLYEAYCKVGTLGFCGARFCLGLQGNVVCWRTAGDVREADLRAVNQLGSSIWRHRSAVPLAPYTQYLPCFRWPSKNFKTFSRKDGAPWSWRMCHLPAQMQSSSLMSPCVLE